VYILYDGDRKSRFIDKQTTGDKLNETGRQTRKFHTYLLIIIIFITKLMDP